MIQPRQILPNLTDSQKLDIHVTCPVCKGTHVVTVHNKAYAQWRGGAHIQDVMPELSPDQRELLITGIDGSCWNRMFA